MKESVCYIGTYNMHVSQNERREEIKVPVPNKGFCSGVLVLPGLRLMMFVLYSSSWASATLLACLSLFSLSLSLSLASFLSLFISLIFPFYLFLLIVLLLSGTGAPPFSLDSS